MTNENHIRIDPKTGKIVNHEEECLKDSVTPDEYLNPLPDALESAANYREGASIRAMTPQEIAAMKAQRRKKTLFDDSAKDKATEVLIKATGKAICSTSATVIRVHPAGNAASPVVKLVCDGVVKLVAKKEVREFVVETTKETVESGKKVKDEIEKIMSTTEGQEWFICRMSGMSSC